MAGATTNPILATGVNIEVERGSNRTSASYVNSFRISQVADRLATHVCNQAKIDPQEFVHLCHSLERGIDFAIANQEVPNRAQDLPPLMKQGRSTGRQVKRQRISYVNSKLKCFPASSSLSIVRFYCYVICSEAKNILLRHLEQRAEEKLRPKRAAAENLAPEHGSKHHRVST
ncbi:hypothetical protein T459_03903 [Capsicum annuum]|uniref:Uncharacterized protein n=1 Tax=Capsicum annuum TaxID=4072 RepID=A0A2G3AP51_CAPAN|nr:hypothetical protein T459_03903 [Capsicum annuum]